MSSTATETLMKMVEELPEPLQERVLEHMRDYVEGLRDDARWSASFAGSQAKLIAAARKARREIAAGKATPLDVDKL